MVDFNIIDVKGNINVLYTGYVDNNQYLLFSRTKRNLYKMLEEGRKCKIVRPWRSLTKQETEQYRRYFCKKAKEDKVNYIYFTVPVTVIEGGDEV